MRKTLLLLLFLFPVILISAIQIPGNVNYNTIQLSDPIPDTIFYCPGGDTLYLITPPGWVEPLWVYNNGQDSLYNDVLVFSNDYEGRLYLNGNLFWLVAVRLHTPGIINAQCGGTVSLGPVNLNYTVPTTPYTYTWEPETGLNDPASSNPSAQVESDITYTVHVGIPDLCTLSEDIQISLIPTISPSICLVGVNENNHNQIIWERPAQAYYDSVFIFRETFITNVYERIGQVSVDESGIFADTTSNPDIQSNKYRLGVKDGCGFESAKSEPHKTIHLTINMGQNNSWNLIWEPYEGFEVSTYRIFRGTDPNDLQQIGSTAGSGRQYTDFSPPQGFVYYQLEVSGPGLCNPAKKTTGAFYASRSNVVTNKPSITDKIDSNAGMFIVYPNPSLEEIRIASLQNRFSEGNIEILDISGKIVHRAILKNGEAIVPVHGLRRGIYIVRIESTEGRMSLKFMR